MNQNKKQPEMTGVFAEKAVDFIDFKRSLGFKYETEPKCLSRFCRFADDFGATKIEITKELAYAWCTPKPNESIKSRGHRVTCVRQFAIYLDSMGYPAYVMPEMKNTCNPSFTPYIFTHDEIDNLLHAVDQTPKATVARDMHLSLPVIFRILYGCGMRVSEVCGLRRSDVDTENGILTIRDSKNGSDRIVPLSSSVHQSLLKYVDAVSWKTDDEFFFRAPDRTQIAPITLYQRYRSYLFQAGISHGGKGKGPRLHDLRHTFAIHALQKWIAEGSDLLAKLPALSVYMGHRNAQSTAKYLRLTAEVYPELMEKIENYSAYVIPGVCHDEN